MTRSHVRLIRFGSAKTLTLAVDIGEKQESQEPTLRYDL